VNVATEEFVTTIGLEIHVELATRTKMFCGCEVAFGGEPNTRVCPVCLGHPGTLPVANEIAVEYATKIAIALGCKIAPNSIFHRKNYFYPDMPKNYQISQYDIPIGSRGIIEIEDGDEAKRIGITRVHLEEDTGKSVHVGGGGRIHEADHSLEDFNRAGTPLVEIVTEPDLASAGQARALVQELRAILEYLEVSDVRMEEGSLRVDANISVARSGEKGIKAEVKNMNSVRSVHRALAYEEQRQRDALAQGATMEQTTRHWDEKSGVTKPLRTKEYAFDYRYFPEPDLVPIEPSVEWLRQLQEEIPELPAERRKRLQSELGLSDYDAATLSSSKAMGEFFDAAVAAAKKAPPKQIANWVANDLAGALDQAADPASKISPASLAGLIDLIAAAEISGPQAKEVLAEMLLTGRTAPEIVESKGIRQISDRDELTAAIDEVIAANPAPAAKVRAGDPKPLGFLVGQVMKSTQGRANPSLVNNLLRERLSATGR
jgi:aspartyl-tRNA(Asn)/glutamyl-tRNA(Gln) amidotransferase subunit B